MNTKKTLKTLVATGAAVAALAWPFRRTPTLRR